jgi:RNA polymerase sigma factor (sigma-70 family)
MITTDAMHTMELNDAELVAESLEGNREAFRRIVERYQNLISSLAYCATGNVSQSEDLAQQTFVSAWKQLAELREPAKLRPWLCSIARFLISKEFRRLGREPVHAAESLEVVDDWVSPEPLPPDQAISEEEKAILWRSLERLPELYREPLVLFYREHQSIETVAHDLELSEDAVKQRLSRGRKLLQEQFLAFVAGALKQTTPGRTFTLGVMASLPLLVVTAKAATVTTAATKGGSVAKAATGAGMFSAFLSGGAMFLFSLVGVFGFFGRWLGRKMGRTRQQSSLGRKRIIQFWRTLAIGFWLLVPCIFLPGPLVHAHPWIFAAEGWSLTAFYWVVAAAWFIWLWQRRRDSRRQEDEKLETDRPTARSYNTWVILGILGPAGIVAMFAFSIFCSDDTWSNKTIPEAEAQKIISEHPDARFTFIQFRNGSKHLEIRMTGDHRIGKETPWTDALQSDLAKNGIAYQTLIEDQDFHDGGARGFTPLLCTFIVVMGAVLLLRRPGTQKFYQQETTTPRAERREKQVLAVGAALAMIALSLLFLLFTLAHQTFSKSVSGVAAQTIILEHKDARFEVFQNDDGSKILFITPPNSRHYPGFRAPADDATLALLAENKLAYKTYVQGRDFGHRDPSPWILWPCIILLPIGAVCFVRRAWKKDSGLPTPGQSNL